MEEIKITDNPANFKIYINGIPDIKLVPKDEIDLIAISLAPVINEIFEAAKSKARGNSQEEQDV